MEFRRSLYQILKDNYPEAKSLSEAIQLEIRNRAQNKGTPVPEISTQELWAQYRLKMGASVNLSSDKGEAVKTQPKPSSLVKPSLPYKDDEDPDCPF